MRKLNEKFGEILRRRREGERGLTLIELLVVMIIIGILAAIAIPIFMNQQKTARDSATTSDVKNAATNIQTLLVKNPDASKIIITDDTVNTAPAVANANVNDADGNGKLRIWVSDEPIDVSVSKGTRLFAASSGDGMFFVKGWNEGGKSYTSNAKGKAYDSAGGGIKN